MQTINNEMSVFYIQKIFSEVYTILQRMEYVNTTNKIYCFFSDTLSLYVSKTIPSSYSINTASSLCKNINKNFFKLFLGFNSQIIASTPVPAIICELILCSVHVTEFLPICFLAFVQMPKRTSRYKY